MESEKLKLGEVVQCAHCQGKGICTSVGPDLYQFPEHYSCDLCCAGQGKLGQKVRRAICYICGGRGHVWIGPDTVNVHE